MPLSIFISRAMKSTVLFVFSIILTATILVPSIIMLIKLDKKTEMVVDFNEDEKKEEKKESSEKDYIFSLRSQLISLPQKEKIKISSFYLVPDYTISISIFLHPPKELFS